MKLDKLIHELPVTLRVPAGHSQDLDIAGLCLNSSGAKPEFLFAALPGHKTHGIEYTASAAKSGAAVVLCESAHAERVLAMGLVAVISDRPHFILAKLAARFYAQRPRVIAAITGTNGKTSGTVFTRQIWTGLGYSAASFGTIGLIGDNWIEPSPLTTPDAVYFHQTLEQLHQRGITHLAFEAGSHGLHQGRIDGVVADVAAFTNLTRDHLDYHKTMQAYFEAKMRLFSDILKPGGTAVINRDIEQYNVIAQTCTRRDVRVIGFGRQKTDLQITDLSPQSDHQILSLNAFGKPHRIRLPLIGAFQAFNAVCAAGMAIGGGDNIDRIIPILEKLTGVPGRMQHVATSPSGAPVFVDYAHTPDAIENVLTALRPHTAGKLVIIFGCGGDRDPGKRPIMGQIASRFADHVIVTDDNPRTEDPAKIRAQILTGSPNAVEIGDRANAIHDAIRDIGPNDILVIAGKGHEQGQIVGQTVLPFDDAEIARHFAKQLSGAAA